MNRQCLLTARPSGIAQAEHFSLVDSHDPVIVTGQILVQNLFLSVDPAMRGWIADVGNYAAPIPLGSVMRSLAVGRIIKSLHPDYISGEILLGWFGWQEKAAIDPFAIVRRVTETKLPLSLALGVLGMNGVTAYLALHQIGRPKVGETIVVSTAAGSVGSAVGQIAKLLGCRVIGIAGGEDKVKQCRSLFSYDDAIDYKTENFKDSLNHLCRDGIDIYFDNTAGIISDAVFPKLAIGGRVIVCGTASIPRWDPWPDGPRLERHLLVKRACMQGFVIFDHMDKWDASVAQLANWIRSGQLSYAEEVLDGMSACPDAIAGLYRGENRGKRVIRV